MHWVIQDNLYREEGMRDLLATLERFGIPHDVVSLDAVTGLMKPDVDPSGLVMACGTYGLAKVAAARGWIPGTFLNENHQHPAWVAAWGELMLNAGAVTGRFADVVPGPGRSFIRPAGDNKFFDGQVLNGEDILAWRDALIRGEKSPVRCSGKVGPDTQVTCGPAVPIYKESRFFVVDGEIVTASTYRSGGEPSISEVVDPEARAFARQTVSAWQPARGFVLDLALTDRGYRIVEVNCLNMSGFYAADVQRLVMAVEAMEFPGTVGTHEPGNS